MSPVVSPATGMVRELPRRESAAEASGIYSKGVTGTILEGYTDRTGPAVFPTLDEAIIELKKDRQAGGITEEAPGRFTVRAGAELVESPGGEVSWLKPEIMFWAGSPNLGRIDDIHSSDADSGGSKCCVTM